MNKSKNRVNIMSSVVAIVVVVGLLFIIGSIVGSILFGTDKKDTVTKPGLNSSYENPMVVDTADANLEAKDFAKKYAKEWIIFNGVIRSTTKLADAKYPYSTLYINDKSLTMMRITAVKATFDDRLQKFANEYSVDPAVNVKVIAKVDGYHEMSDSVELEAKNNVSGDTPSVMSR